MGIQDLAAAQPQVNRRPQLEIDPSADPPVRRSGYRQVATFRHAGALFLWAFCAGVIAIPFTQALAQVSVEDAVAALSVFLMVGYVCQKIVFRSLPFVLNSEERLCPEMSTGEIVAATMLTFPCLAAFLGIVFAFCAAAYHAVDLPWATGAAWHAALWSVPIAAVLFAVGLLTARMFSAHVRRSPQEELRLTVCVIEGFHSRFAL